MQPTRLSLAFSLAALALVAAPLCAVNMNGPSPADVQPQSRWGELKPVDSPSVATARDRSSFNDLQVSWDDAFLFRDLHIEGNYMFVATNAGFEVWDMANPIAPAKLSSIKSLNFPIYPDPHSRFICTRDVACPPGSTDVAVLAMDKGQGGVVIFNTQNKQAPFVIYQDSGPTLGGTDRKTAKSVYCATINGTRYAFAAVDSATNGSVGVNIYNLDIALSLTTPLKECGFGNTGVHVGQGMRHTFTHPTTGTPLLKNVHTVTGIENFVVTGGFPCWDIWDVSSPVNPVRKGGSTSLGSAYEATIWKDGNSYYVAVLQGPTTWANTVPKELRIYDVTAIINGTATAPGAAIAVISLANFSSTAPTEGRLCFSRTGSGVPMLCFSGGPVSTIGPTWLEDKHQSVLDVTNPATPREVTPPAPQFLKTFWGTMFEYGWVSNQTAYFKGNYLYRASMGIMDIYEWNASQANQPPVVTSTPVTTATVGQAYSYAITVTDPESDPITFTSIQMRAGMSLSASGLVTWVPGSADIGNHLIKVNVSDGHSSVIHEWTVSVTQGGGGTPNQPPTVTSTPVTSVAALSQYGYTVTATDPEGNTLTYVKAFGPAMLTVNPASGAVSWLPQSADVGAHSIIVNVTDGTNTVAHAWVLNVTAPGGGNPPPPAPGGGGVIGGGGGGGCAAYASDDGAWLTVLALLLMAVSALRLKAARR